MRIIGVEGLRFLVLIVCIVIVSLLVRLLHGDLVDNAESP